MMKKYLMTGMAAVALSAAFTSCSNNEVFDPDRSQTADQVTMAYNQAFVKTFGQPAANQDWGFGTRANTRYAYPNGNMWEEEGWNIPPELTNDQKNIVRQYFQQNPNPGYTDPQWTNFWVQQVYKGGTNTADGSQTPEEYTIGNNTKVTGGDNMDKLASKDANGTEDHVNDFNSSDNNDWKGRMLMVESSTYSFGYNNSNGSVYHYDKAALVSWTVIRDWANAKGLNGDLLNDGWNRSYMGFDWEQVFGDDVYDAIYDYAHADYSVNPAIIPILGFNEFEFDGQTYRYLSSNTNQYAYDENEPTFGGKVNYNDKPSDDIIRQLLSLGYLPVAGSADKEWIKVATGADGYYSDWIVTLTEAKQQQNDTPTIPTPDYTIRVIGEDLSASDATDFDFNDVVFDVALNFNGKTWVKLQAAGGTLPLIIGVTPADDQDYPENEVHNRFGGYSTSTMINTNASAHGKAVDGVAPVEIELAQAYEDARDIPVYVKKNGTWVELTAVQGEPASKIGVATTFQWVDERVSLRERYPRFSEWVTQGNGLIWY